MQNIRNLYNHQQPANPYGCDKDIPDDIFQQFVLAMKLGRKGCYQQAELLLLPLLNTEHPLRYAVIDLLVRVYVQQGQADKAEHVLQEAVRLVPHHKGFQKSLMDLQGELSRGQFTWFFKRAFLAAVILVIAGTAFWALNNVKANQNRILNELVLLKSSVMRSEDTSIKQFQQNAKVSGELLDLQRQSQQVSKDVSLFQQQNQQTSQDLASISAQVQEIQKKLAEPPCISIPRLTEWWANSGE
jgi:hypothetical protein